MTAVAVRTWGTTRRERARPFPCDRWLPDADDALYRAVDVDAPPAVVFRWLCQLRVAPYSYDWIDNLGRRSPHDLTAGLDRLALGQRVMTFFELVEFGTDRHLTIRSTASALGTFAASYVVLARAGGGSRLVVKLLVRWPRGPLRWATRLLFPVGDLVMMRRQLLTLKRLAERTERPRRSK